MRSSLLSCMLGGSLLFCSCNCVLSRGGLLRSNDSSSSVLRRSMLSSHLLRCSMLRCYSLRRWVHATALERTSEATLGHRWRRIRGRGWQRHLREGRI